MKSFIMLAIVGFITIITGCGRQNLENGMPCLEGADCISGICTSNKCVGRPLGATCSVPGECVSSQCEGNKCVAQTCSPACLPGDVCLGTSANRCAPATGAFNGESCLATGDRGCLSLKCDAVTNTCLPRSDGAYCTQTEQCWAGSSCLYGACQPTGSTCTACTVGQKCVNGACVAVKLEAKDACVANSNCVSDACDAGPRNYLTCRSGGTTCTPQCPTASTIACGTPITPTNSCGTCAGTGTYCATGTCNGTSCVTTIDGPTLYANNCASCHGALASSTKRNRTATQIQTAITNNTGGMGTTTLRALTSAQVQAIANALATSTSDFTVTSSATIAVQQGLSATSTITVSSIDSSTKTVALTVSGAPTGVTTSYNPSSVTVSGTSSTTSVLTVSVATSVAVGNYNLTVTGTSGSNTRTATLVLAVSASGGTGLPLGSSCTSNSQCASSNCGPPWATVKVCNGSIDIDQTATNSYECHSGVFITGTTRCAPDQFKLCTNYAGINVSAWTDTGSGGSFKTGTDGCWVSDPALNHRSASENGDTSKCVQYTFWTPATGAICKWNTAYFMAIWNTGRTYN